MTCDQRRDLLLLYLSDALAADEKQELRRHLATGCPECAGYLAEAEATFNSIPLALDPVSPSAGLKKRLMDRIAAAESTKPTVIVRPQLDSDSLPIRLFRFLVPAAVAAGIAVVTTHAFMNQKVQKLALEMGDSRRDASASRMLVQSLQQQFQSQAQVVEMLRAPDVKIVHLKPGEAQTSMVANIVWDQVDRRWLFLASGMKPAATGQTYEMWVIPKTGTPIPAGTFDVDASGKAIVSVELPKGSGDTGTAAVTNETAGGVPSPKGSIQVSGVID